MESGGGEESNVAFLVRHAGSLVRHVVAENIVTTSLSSVRSTPFYIYL